MSSQGWSWFGDAAHVALRDWRRTVPKYLISIHFCLTFFHFSLPVSVCLVIGGATVAGLKAGPETGLKKIKIKKSQKSRLLKSTG